MVAEVLTKKCTVMTTCKYNITSRVRGVGIRKKGPFSATVMQIFAAGIYC